MAEKIRKITEHPIRAFRDLEHSKLTNIARYAYYLLRELDPRPYAKFRRQLLRNRGNPDAIFVHIPKTAGTSLISLLEEDGALWLRDKRTIRNYSKERGLICFSHFSIPDLIKAGYLSSEYVQRAWKFAFVRNPYDRAVSLYLYSIGNVGQTLAPSTTFGIFCSYLEAKAYEPIGLYVSKGLSQLNPQSTWLVDHDGAFLCDFVGKVENLENDFEHVRKTLALKGHRKQLPRENVMPRQPIESYYSERELEIVARVYAEDFKRFGYDSSRLPQE